MRLSPPSGMMTSAYRLLGSMNCRYVGIDEDFDVEHVAEWLETEEQDAFDDDDGNGIDVNGIVEEARVCFEVVERDVDGLTAFEPFEVIDE